jgi:uncharacterized protein YcnI
VVRRALVLIGLFIGVLGVAGPAYAHVTVQPGEAPQGGFTTQFFQVPNEEDDAATVELQVTFPTDYPILSVRTEPVPGWQVRVEMAPLATPIEDEDGQITEAVGTVTWSGGRIEPGQFQRFPFSFGPTPDAPSLEFKAVQTYSDGEQVRWIESATPGGEEPERPAPVLTLVKEDTDDAAATTTATLPTDIATTSDVDSAKTVGIIGVVLGALGLIAAVVALVRKPRTAA